MGQANKWHCEQKNYCNAFHSDISLFSQVFFDSSKLYQERLYTHTSLKIATDFCITRKRNSICNAKIVTSIRNSIQQLFHTFSSFCTLSQVLAHFLILSQLLAHLIILSHLLAHLIILSHLLAHFLNFVQILLCNQHVKP